MSASWRTSEASRPTSASRTSPMLGVTDSMRPVLSCTGRDRIGAQLLGPLQRGVGVGDVGLEGGELVAVEPAQADDVGHGGAQALGHGQQHLVPHGMAQRVVDELEPVEVEEEHDE